MAFGLGVTCRTNFPGDIPTYVIIVSTFVFFLKFIVPGIFIVDRELSTL